MALQPPERLRRVTEPRVTAIVVVHGSPAEIVRACVESLLDATGIDVSVVLVDNASPDAGAACAPWALHRRVELVTSVSNDGFAAGVKQGLLRARGNDFVFLLNDDATVAPDAIERCIAVLTSHPGAIAAAPRVMLADEPDRIDSIGVVVRPNGEAFNAYIGQRWTDQVADGDDVFGPCFSAALMRADAFHGSVVGPLDARYRLYYEDIDWDLRAQRAGWRTVAVPSAVVLHRHASSTRLMGEATRYEMVQRNLLLCALKNFTIISALRVWVSRLVTHAKGTITGPYRVQRIRSIGRAVVDAPPMLLARRRLPRTRARTDAELFAYSLGMTPQFDADTYRSTSV